MVDEEYERRRQDFFNRKARWREDMLAKLLGFATIVVLVVGSWLVYQAATWIFIWLF